MADDGVITVAPVKVELQTTDDTHLIPKNNASIVSGKPTQTGQPSLKIRKSLRERSLNRMKKMGVGFEDDGEDLALNICLFVIIFLFALVVVSPDIAALATSIYYWNSECNNYFPHQNIQLTPIQLLFVGSLTSLVYFLIIFSGLIIMLSCNNQCSSKLQDNLWFMGIAMLLISQTFTFIWALIGTAIKYHNEFDSTKCDESINSITEIWIIYKICISIVIFCGCPFCICMDPQ